MTKVRGQYAARRERPELEKRTAFGGCTVYMPNEKSKTKRKQLEGGRTIYLNRWQDEYGLFCYQQKGQEEKLYTVKRCTGNIEEYWLIVGEVSASQVDDEEQSA